MKKHLVAMVSLMSVLGASAWAQGTPGPAPEMLGRVLSVTPVAVQVPVQTRVCGATPVVVQQPNSGGGALLGAIAGGVVGNALGGGVGKALATAAGVVGGAMVGNSVESAGNTPQVVNAQQCVLQTAYQNKTQFSVVYEFENQQYTVQMPVDPGSTIQLQAATTQPPQAVAAQPGVTVVGQAPVTVVVPAYYPTPYYYTGYYYPYFPIGVSVGYGRYWGGRGWGGGHRWH